MRRLVLLGWVPGSLLLCCSALVGPAAPAAADGGRWVWPVDGPREVARAFAPPQTRYGTGHRGADLASQVGAAVGSAGAGRVSYAGLLAGRGVVVVVHGELRTTYEPVTAAVSVGDQVLPGQLLGRLDGGHAGCAVRACLHWGLRRGEAYLDPVRLVRAGPVRLLPLDATGRSPGSAPAGAGAAGGPVRQEAARSGVLGGVGAPGGSGATSATGRATDPTAAPRPGASAPPTLPTAATASASGPDRSVALALVAVAALVGGIGLLRPRPGPPRGPLPPGPLPRTPSPAGAAPPDDPLPSERAGSLGEVLELETERLRRRAG